MVGESVREPCESQSNPGYLEGSRGQSQPQIGAAAFATLDIFLGRPF